MSDSQNIGDQGTYANYTWYQRLVQGAASRVTRYREYDLMDNDIEISRSLDTIAEEMIGSDPNSDMPLKLNIHPEKGAEVPSSSVVALRAALRYWNDIHGWDTKLFSVCRNTIKYGDSFFIRRENNTWEHSAAKNVVSAIVDDRDMTNIVGWQIKQETKSPNSPYNQSNHQFGQNSNEAVDTFTADQVIRFTLNDEMSESAPFGESILRAVYRAYKQKELLEDAIIIYRIQRAPERRVFHVDVGKLPPHRVKPYLESFKNEIRQRKIPTYGGGTNQVDSVYNPQQMSEDFFFAARADGGGNKVETLPGGCFSMDTKVSMLDGTELSIAEVACRHEAGEEQWVYSCDELTGEIKPGLVSWAGVTQSSARVMKLTLDNGEEIVCTPDHKFPIAGNGFVRADEMEVGVSLIPLYRRREQLASSAREYEQVFDNASKQWVFTHRMVRDNVDLDRRVGSQRLLQKLRTDSEFNQLFRSRISNAWTDEMRAEVAVRSKERAATYAQDATIIEKRRAEHQSRQKPMVPQIVFNFIVDSVKDKTTHEMSAGHVVSLINSDSVMRAAYVEANQHKRIPNADTTGGITVTILRNCVKDYGYSSWKQFRDTCQYHNHRVAKIEYLTDRIEVGTLTIDDAEIIHGHHTFALSCGVFTKNSGLGELSDLEYFQWKMLRGLRIPLSFMREGQEGAMSSDGKTGVAYIQELRFALYVKRLANHISSVLDTEFKRFVRTAGITVDPTLYTISLNEPENFGKYRQQQMDTDLLNTYQMASGIEHMSKRFAQRRFLQMSEEDIAINFRMRCEELGLDPDDRSKAMENMRVVYGPPPGDAGMMGGDMGGGMMAGTMGGPGFADPTMGGDPGAMGGDMGGAPPPQGGEMPQPQQ